MLKLVAVARIACPSFPHMGPMFNKQQQNTRIAVDALVDAYNFGLARRFLSAEEIESERARLLVVAEEVRATNEGLSPMHDAALIRLLAAEQLNVGTLEQAEMWLRSHGKQALWREQTATRKAPKVTTNVVAPKPVTPRYRPQLNFAED